MTAFHWNDNVFFERLPSGDVRVWKTMFKGGPMLFELVVPAKDWCSIVSACSVNPGYKTFRQVEKIHKGR